MLEQLEPTAAPPRAGAPRSVRIGILAAIALICAALVWWSAWGQSVTSDEAAHLPAGYSYLRTGDFRLNPEHPPLAKLVCALPVLAFHPKVPIPSVAWKEDDEWAFGWKFLAENKAILVPMVAWARLPMALLTGLLLFVTGWWVSEVFGLGAGILAALLLGANPEILNHGRWVTTDMPAAALGFFTLYTAWKWLSRPGWKRASIMGLTLGLAVASKDSCLILPPMMLLQALAFIFSGRARPSWRDWSIALVACAAGPVIVLMACYESWTGPLRYISGMTGINANHLVFYLRYLMGHIQYSVYPQYFVMAWLLKTPFPLLVAALVGIGALAVAVGAALRNKTGLAPDVWDGLALLAGAVLVFALMSWKADDIGVRYILPTVPIFAWLSARAFARTGRRGRAVLVVLALWGLVDAWRAWPDLGGAFDEFLPGPTVAYLDDSNVNWGEGLIALKAEMKRLKLDRIGYGALGGRLDPRIYGLKLDRSVEGLAGLPEPGWYAFDPSFLLRCPGFLWLAYRRPDFNADGYWIYHLQGDIPEQAHQAYTALLKQRPYDPFLWYHVASQDEAEGKLHRAEKELGIALKIWPGYLDARKSRAALRLRLGDAAGAKADDAIIAEIVKYVLAGLRNKAPGSSGGLWAPLGG